MVCQNTQNMKISPATDTCGRGNSVKERALK